MVKWACTSWTLFSLALSRSSLKKALRFNSSIGHYSNMLRPLSKILSRRIIIKMVCSILMDSRQLSELEKLAWVIMSSARHSTWSATLIRTSRTRTGFCRDSHSTGCTSHIMLQHVSRSLRSQEMSQPLTLTKCHRRTWSRALMTVCHRRRVAPPPLTEGQLALIRTLHSRSTFLPNRKLRSTLWART